MPLSVAVLMSLTVLGACAVFLLYGIAAFWLIATRRDIWVARDNVSWLSYILFPVSHLLGRVGKRESYLMALTHGAAEVLFLVWPVFMAWNLTLAVLFLGFKLSRAAR